MRLKVRIHEWLADRISWVQYPQIQPLSPYARPTLWRQYQNMTGKERGWFWFFVFWGAIALLVRLAPD